MRESIPIAARLIMGWKVGNSHSAQSTILGYTLMLIDCTIPLASHRPTNKTV